MAERPEPRFETLAVHGDGAPDPHTGAVVAPISLATTFAQEAVGRHRGYEYARTGNPTRAALERCVALLEGGAHGLAFASGMAAEDAILRTLRPGDHVVLGHDAYGGTFRLLSRVFEPVGIASSVADMTDAASLAGALREETRLVWVETPSNPLLSIVDIGAVAAATHDVGARLVVDNTFATPFLQRPLGLDADVVVHSSTKYLGGHSDVVGGVVVTDDPMVAEQLAFVQNAVGAVPSPLDCYLVLRGIKTLALRMDRHCGNAAAVADVLADHPAVESVLYPGLADHPNHAVAARQMRGFGGMVSFLASGGPEAARRICEATSLFTLAESLGAVESLIEHPGAMTHASAAGSPLEVPDHLVRLSVGVESIVDLLEDLTAALDTAA